MSFLGMADIAKDVPPFRTQKQLVVEGWNLKGNVFHRDDHAYLPLYEGNFVRHFDHRFATVDAGRRRDCTLQEKLDADFTILPRYWVPDALVAEKLGSRWLPRWCLSFRPATNRTNERTFLACLLPRVGVGDNLPLLLTAKEHVGAVPFLLANLNSFAFDYAVRLRLCRTKTKVSGSRLKHVTIGQLPIMPPTTYEQSCPWASNQRAIKAWILPRVLELTYTAWDLEPFARDCGYDGPTFRWDEARRFLLRCELDAAFFLLYGLTYDDATAILNTFSVVRRKEKDCFGEYRTQRVILEIYKAMAEAQRTGQPYQTLLNPPPADPRVAHPPRDKTSDMVIKKAGEVAKSVTALATKTGIHVPRPQEVETYLQAFPDLCPHVAKVLPLAKAELGHSAELTLDVFYDRDSDDRYLNLLVRQEHYSPRLMTRIKDFRAKKCEFLTSTEGWFHITTDFQKPHNKKT